MKDAIEVQGTIIGLSVSPFENRGVSCDATTVTIGPANLVPWLVHSECTNTLRASKNNE